MMTLIVKKFNNVSVISTFHRCIREWAWLELRRYACSPFACMYSHCLTTRCLLSRTCIWRTPWLLNWAREASGRFTKPNCGTKTWLWRCSCPPRDSARPPKVSCPRPTWGRNSNSCSGWNTPRSWPRTGSCSNLASENCNQPGTARVGAISKAQLCETLGEKPIMLYEKWKRYIRTLKTLCSNFETLHPNFESLISELWNITFELWKRYIRTLKTLYPSTLWSRWGY